MPLERYRWSALTNQQVGAFVEYIVKMELTMFGFQVHGTEVDDRGVDFIAQFGDGDDIWITEQRDCWDPSNLQAA